jgi:hypothetical protein
MDNTVTQSSISVLKKKKLKSLSPLLTAAVGVGKQAHCAMVLLMVTPLKNK